MSSGHIGRYEILQPLGRGGMAEVYLARPTGDPRSVVYALKCILPHHADDPRFLQMFHRELTIATGLCHPNLVSVLDHGIDEGRHFMLMEYVHGPDLAKLLRRSGERDRRPPLDAALSIVIEVARGLHHLHEWPGKEGGAPGFVHRDVSPSNVLVGFDGTVKVTDFGVATASAHTRTTDAGGVKGKMGYLSPEQCRSEALDRRSDIYALGVLLYEATVGERLFYGDNDYAVMHQIVSSDYDRPTDRAPNYPRDLEAIILTALAEDREDRFSTAASFADAIEAFARREGANIGQETVANWVASLVEWQPYPAFGPTATPRAVPVQARPAKRRPNRLPLLAAIAAPAAIGALIAGVMLRGVEPEPDASPAATAPAAEPRDVERPQDAPAVAPPHEPAPAQEPTDAPPPIEVLEVEPAPDPEPVAADAPERTTEAAPEPEASTPSKRQRRKRRRRRAKPRPSGYDLDAPRPPR